MAERFYAQNREPLPKRAKAMEAAQTIDKFQIIGGLLLTPVLPALGLAIAGGSVATYAAEELYKRKVIRDEKKKRQQMSVQLPSNAQALAA